MGLTEKDDNSEGSPRHDRDSKLVPLDYKEVNNFYDIPDYITSKVYGDMATGHISCQRTELLTYLLTYLLITYLLITYLLTYLLITYLLTYSLAHTRTHSLTYSLTYLLMI